MDSTGKSCQKGEIIMKRNIIIVLTGLICMFLVSVSYAGQVSQQQYDENYYQNVIIPKINVVDNLIKKNNIQVMLTAEKKLYGILDITKKLKLEKNQLLVQVYALQYLVTVQEYISEFYRISGNDKMCEIYKNKTVVSIVIHDILVDTYTEKYIDQNITEISL